MPTPEEDENLFTQFLDDYFAECDEHLTAIRQNILAIESFVNQPQVERSLLDKLFGSFHSLKGLSGMVGLKEAEQLAHEMENYLRSLREVQVILTQPGIDALIFGVKTLEQVINNYRIQAPIPDIVPSVERLAAAFSANLSPEKNKPNLTSPPAPLLQGEESGNATPPFPCREEESAGLGLSQLSPTSNFPNLNLKPEEKKRIIAAIESGARAWQIQFSPTPEKAAQGINVNSIRQRLQSIGELVCASPRVVENGVIVFDFVITSHVDAATFNQWEQDGLVLTPYLLAEPEGEKVLPQNSVGTNLLPKFAIETKESIAKPTPTTQKSKLKTNETVPSNIVRVDLLRLDELMRMVGELVVTRARLEDNIKTLKNSIPASGLRTLRENTLTLERQLRDLREGVMRVRLVPIGEIFTRMQFVIRDLAKETQKQIKLELSGQNTEIDKFLVERTIDPLLHLVRNAISHGLEEEAERIANGKPKEGKISLRAFTAGETVIIEVEDDGRGVDLEKVIKLAKQQRENGPIASRFSNVSDRTLDPITILDIICSSGFSTREKADKISGRGVGMAVVKNTVQELGGSLALDTTPGKGTKFTIQLPLTLAIADVSIVSVAEQIFAIPLSSVREVMQVRNTDLTYLENNEIIAYRGNVLPIIRLRKIFNIQTQDNEAELKDEFLNSKEADNSKVTRSPNLRLVVLGNGMNAVGIAVDRILGQQEIVVRPLNDPLVQVAGIAGATELGDGRVVLIIDPVALIRMVIINRQSPIANSTFAERR